MMTALTIRPFIAIVLAASGFAAADLAPVLSSDGEGGLRKDGKPFRAIGVNYFSCFYRTLLDGADTSYEQGFEVLAREGIPFVRFAATGFCPTDMALYRTDREEYFRRFDFRRIGKAAPSSLLHGTPVRPLPPSVIKSAPEV